MQKKLADWENCRENERRSLMLKEAEVKQKDGVWTRSKNRESGFLERWILRWSMLLNFLGFFFWSFFDYKHI